MSPSERRIAIALARAAMPAGARLPAGGEATIDRLEAFLEKGGAFYRRAVQAGLYGVETAAVATTGRPFSRLAPERAERLLESWSQSQSPKARQLLRAVLLPLKMAHFDDPTMFEHVGCPYGRDVAKQRERRPWMSQVEDGRTLTSDRNYTCEVVVVGTGAGGAAAAYELARRGRAVMMLEVGDYHHREDFTGRAGDAFHKMYLARGATFALGNMGGPVWAGRGVGGSTTINSGTCYRAPESTLRDWHRTDGLTMFTSESLASYYSRVEAMLGVEVAASDLLGGAARVVARGADALGLSHHPLKRNAPGCDGQGVCCFGCPTGAKRSTDVSYAPEALKRGATLLTGARADHVFSEGGRARGVVGQLSSGASFRVRAEVVVVAGGALMTPLLLRRGGQCARSGQLGRNLSIHPASKVMALFDEDIDMSRGIPQSYAIDTYSSEGLMFEGASTPLDVTAMAVPWVGRRFTEVIENFPKLATFGFMVKDVGRGRVFSGPNDMPVIHYDLHPEDIRRLQKGVEVLSEVFLRAGARRVLPMVPGCDELHGEADLARLRALKLGAGDFDIAAFHPLGTCRMGTDPRRSCVGPTLEAHDLRDLFVADGSAIPSSLGVNPQMTIMALALRTAEVIDERLGGSTASAPPLRHGPASAPTLAGVREDSNEGATEMAGGFEFRETMSGVWRRGAQGPDRPLTFTLHCRAESLLGFARKREVTIQGVVDAETLATARPLEGTLGLDVLRTGTLPYAFWFTGDDGETYRFSGQKTLHATSLLRDMTRLPAELHDAGGAPVGDAVVHFDVRGDLYRFLRSWKLV